MDDGEELAMLNEPWTFLGMKLNELISGSMVMMLILALTQTKSPAIMPLVLIAGIASSMIAATLRRRYPDEERGVRNYFMVKMGFTPPGIPAPSELQPYWSGSPIRELKTTTRFIELGLDEIFTEEMIEERKVKLSNV